MITVLGVLMGIDMQGFAREEGSDELPPGVSKADVLSETSTSVPPPAASTSKSAPAEDVKMADPEPEEEDEDAKAKKDALAEKAKGNEAYKKRDFDEAAVSFKKAWDLWPQDITFLTNLAGMFKSIFCFPNIDELRQLPSLRKGCMMKLLQHAKLL